MMNRNEVMKKIKANLKARTGRTWSVTGGRGTAYGWLSIDAPPARRKWQNVDSGERDERGMPVYNEVFDTSREFGHMGPEDRAILAEALGMESVHHQGVSIPSSHGHYQEYLDRSEGKVPTVYGERYWD